MEEYTIREFTEQEEKARLSPHACCAADSRGRERPVPPCPLRTCFQRDRDRVVHCKAFRRLSHKTQVFLSPEGDHYRTRLTHTLEVSQIARTVSRALRLNEDLTEAIALGHDLGHTPFGHAGEQALRELCGKDFFSHAEQSVRVVEKLENGGHGLNLCYEVRDGIARHSFSSELPHTLEGQVVRFCDKIAYINHDIDDAVRAGVLKDNDVPWNLQYTLGRGKSERITTMAVSLVRNSSDAIRMDDETFRAYEELRAFMFEAVYLNKAAKKEEGKARDVVKRLFSYFSTHSHKLPDEYQEIARDEGVSRAVCDYISGMSDRYAVSVFESLFVPKGWGSL